MKMAELFNPLGPIAGTTCHRLAATEMSPLQRPRRHLCFSGGQVGVQTQYRVPPVSLCLGTRCGFRDGDPLYESPDKAGLPLDLIKMFWAFKEKKKKKKMREIRSRDRGSPGSEVTAPEPGTVSQPSLSR